MAISKLRSTLVLASKTLLMHASLPQKCQTWIGTAVLWFVPTLALSQDLESVPLEKIRLIAKASGRYVGIRPENSTSGLILNSLPFAKVFMPLPAKRQFRFVAQLTFDRNKFETPQNPAARLSICDSKGAARTEITIGDSPEATQCSVELIQEKFRSKLVIDGQEVSDQGFELSLAFEKIQNGVFISSVQQAVSGDIYTDLNKTASKVLRMRESGDLIYPNGTGLTFPEAMAKPKLMAIPRNMDLSQFRYLPSQDSIVAQRYDRRSLVFLSLVDKDKQRIDGLEFKLLKNSVWDLTEKHFVEFDNSNKILRRRSRTTGAVEASIVTPVLNRAGAIALIPGNTRHGSLVAVFSEGSASLLYDLSTLTRRKTRRSFNAAYQAKHAYVAAEKLGLWRAGSGRSATELNFSTGGSRLLVANGSTEVNVKGNVNGTVQRVFAASYEGTERYQNFTSAKDRYSLVVGSFDSTDVIHLDTVWNEAGLTTVSQYIRHGRRINASQRQQMILRDTDNPTEQLFSEAATHIAYSGKHSVLLIYFDETGRAALYDLTELNSKRDRF